MADVITHLVDGTYELFRHYFAVPARAAADGSEMGAARGVVDNVVRLLESGATHVGVATDHVIESYRNELFAGYKTGEGIDPVLFGQFGLLEDALRAIGVTVWPMVDFEADDALAAAAAVADADPRVRQVRILTPDKDLGQCVRGTRVVQVDRRKELVVDEDGVRAKFGVGPAAIPDYLALVGDTADGIPGIPGFGAKGAAAVLGVYGSLDGVPTAPGQWDVPGLRGAAKLAATLAERRDEAFLYRELATLQTVGPEVGAVDAWRWAGPADDLAAWAAFLALPNLPRRLEKLAAERS